jgi:hypothetical protein
MSRCAELVILNVAVHAGRVNAGRAESAVMTPPAKFRFDDDGEVNLHR